MARGGPGGTLSSKPAASPCRSTAAKDAARDLAVPCALASRGGSVLRRIDACQPEFRESTMTYASVAFHLDAHPGLDDRIDQAARLARRFESHLVGISAADHSLFGLSAATGFAGTPRLAQAVEGRRRQAGIRPAARVAGSPRRPHRCPAGTRRQRCLQGIAIASRRCRCRPDRDGRVGPASLGGAPGGRHDADDAHEHERARPDVALTARSALQAVHAWPAPWMPAAPDECNRRGSSIHQSQVLLDADRPLSPLTLLKARRGEAARMGLPARAGSNLAQ
jgi:hypothetical protein